MRAKLLLVLAIGFSYSCTNEKTATPPSARTPPPQLTLDTSPTKVDESFYAMFKSVPADAQTRFGLAYGRVTKDYEAGTNSFRLKYSHTEGFSPKNPHGMNVQEILAEAERNAADEKQYRMLTAAKYEAVRGKVWKASHGWKYSSDHDEMRGRDYKWATIESTDKQFFEPPYDGGSSLILSFRADSKGRKQVYFMISKGQLSCSYQSCSVAAKFDDGRIETFYASEADGRYDALFINNYKEFLQKTKTAKRLLVEIRTNAGDRQFHFEIADLEWS